ncbi:MAG: hypothetical protein KY476_12465 [Planctomycetes bacterium]|nr:hypothetical protein [Planctomycetota bacterium]
MSELFASGEKCYGVPPRFDPEDGTAIAEPPGSGYGYWAGAPSAAFDRSSGRFYVYYRVRHPLTKGRGGECRIAAGEPGGRFEAVWSASKDAFGANSIEKGCLIRDPAGPWRLYLSYEVGRAYDRNPPTWRIDLLEADSPDQFDPATARPVIDAPMYGFTFVKDPTVIVVGGEYHVYTSVGLPEQHLPADADGVIQTRGRGWAALHRSHDGVNFPTARIVMEPRQSGWDAFNVRITSVCRLPPVWLAFYDGATHRADSYDEFCGQAVSEDLVNFRRLSVNAPWIRSPHASGSIRYLDALPVDDTLHYFYEYTRPDRSHELRHSAVPLARPSAPAQR